MPNIPVLGTSSVDINYAPLVDGVALVQNQTTSIPVTTLIPDTGSGPTLWRIGINQYCVTAGSNGSVQTVLSFTEPHGNNTQATAALNLSVLAKGSTSIFCVLNPNTSVTYQTTVSGPAGNPFFTIAAFAEKLTT